MKETFLHAHKTIISVIIIIAVLGAFAPHFFTIKTVWAIVFLVVTGIIGTFLSHQMTKTQQPMTPTKQP
jgi:uncharacterized membrane protein YeaQ/YmgE (transglycosylase-associated protein family)